MPGERGKRTGRGYTKGAEAVAAQKAHILPVFDAELVQRVYEASPLKNADIRLAFAQAYVLVNMQLNDLKARITDGTIVSEEARTIPALVQRLAQLSNHLHLTDTKDTDLSALESDDDESDDSGDDLEL